jgi:hypothetical protein
LRLTTKTANVQLNTCGYRPYVTFSLTRGWVCRLQLLLVLASAVILGSKSRGIHDIFYCLRFEIPSTWMPRSPYFYPPGTRWPSYMPRHWVPFSSPSTTRSATVEVFEPASSSCFSSEKDAIFVKSNSSRSEPCQQQSFIVSCGAMQVKKIETIPVRDRRGL